MDYAKHRVSLSPVQRAILAAGAAAISFVDPFRGDMIACLAETTGTDALSYCHRKMLATSEGSRILARKPRISSSTIDFSALRRLPQGTLGRIYCDFLDVNVSSFDLTPLDSIRFDRDIRRQRSHQSIGRFLQVISYTEIVSAFLQIGTKILVCYRTCPPILDLRSDSLKILN